MLVKVPVTRLTRCLARRDEINIAKHRETVIQSIQVEQQRESLLR